MDLHPSDAIVFSYYEQSFKLVVTGENCTFDGLCFSRLYNLNFMVLLQRDLKKVVQSHDFSRNLSKLVFSFNFNWCPQFYTLTFKNPAPLVVVLCLLQMKLWWFFSREIEVQGLRQSTYRLIRLRIYSFTHQYINDDSDDYVIRINYRYIQMQSQ